MLEDVLMTLLSSLYSMISIGVNFRVFRNADSVNFKHILNALLATKVGCFIERIHFVVTIKRTSLVSKCL